MRGWIAWMVRCRKQWLHLRVELEGANGPVGIFAVPAGDAGIKRGDVLEGVGACRQRRIIVEPVLEDEAADLPAPILVSTRAAGGILPEIGGRIRFGRALEGLELSKLGAFLGRIVRKRSRRPELARGREHPGLPRRHLRQDRVGPVPFARPGWDAAGPLGVGAVSLAALDHARGDAASELEAGADVTGILHTREHARSACLFPLRRER